MVSTCIINCITTCRFGLLLYQNSPYRTLMDISLYVCLNLHNCGYSISIYNHNSLHISIDPVMKTIDFYFSLKSAIENTYVDESYNRNCHLFQLSMSIWYLYPHSPKGEGGILFFIPPLPEGGGEYTVLPLSVRPYFRPSKIFFITFFSVTVDGRNLIFGHKCHIGIS